MKALRPFLWAAILVAGFLYVTAGPRWDLGRWLGRGSTGPLWSEPASAATAYTPDEQNNIEIYKNARDATVNITSKVYQQDWFSGGWADGAGSGFIIKQSGEVLTNSHVVKGAQQVTVTLTDKKVYRARILGIDARSDLALLKIDADHKLPTLPLGNADSLVVGQKVLAIGNPFGQFGGTLTTGVVSALDRSIQTDEGGRLEGMIQTDAAINPGNSGGPLLDSHGSVIGINTAIYGPQGNIGIGFALPIGRAKAMLEEFEKSGNISRPAPIGVQALAIDGDLAEQLRLPREGGLLIQQVEPGSAADEAGLHGPTRSVIVDYIYQIHVGGDLIMAADGQPITSNDSLQRVLSRKRGGDILTLTVYRGGRKVDVKIKLGEAPRQL
jgi:S1-C subfamily serine protease